VYEHWKTTGETIKFDDIRDTMYGGALPVAPKKRKSKKQATSEDVDEEESSEPKPKKAKKEKAVVKVNVVGSAMPTIQEEVQEVELQLHHQLPFLPNHQFLRRGSIVSEI